MRYVLLYNVSTAFGPLIVVLPTSRLCAKLAKQFVSSCLSSYLHSVVFDLESEAASVSYFHVLLFHIQTNRVFIYLLDAASLLMS